MTPGARIRAESALWIANSDAARAAVLIEDPETALEHIAKAQEALEQAARAIRGYG